MLKQVYPRERATPLLIVQEAVLGVFREETHFCLCRDTIPPIVQSVAYDFQTTRHSVCYFMCIKDIVLTINPRPCFEISSVLTLD